MENAVDKAAEIKRKIIEHIEKNGPSLPVAVSREIGISSLFSSAFLSELIEDEKIKISKMKVGGSPLYFLPRQQQMLENFSRYLPEKEKEALRMLKDKQILKDAELEPAIRVALRSLKDFAYPLVTEHDNIKEIYWRHVIMNDNDAKQIISEKFVKTMPIAQPIQPVTHEFYSQIQKPEPKLDIFSKCTEKPVAKEKSKPGFPDEVKAFLERKNMRILEVDKLDKKEFTAKIKLGEKEVLLVAVDKKRIDESDLLKAHKKAQQVGMPYFILARGEAPKKLKDAIEAYKMLERIEKID
jgi:hypothetical protein